MFGDQYRRYRAEVAMLIPLPSRKSSDRPDPPAPAPTRSPL
jgi:hypothetical protein